MNCSAILIAGLLINPCHEIVLIDKGEECHVETRTKEEAPMPVTLDISCREINEKLRKVRGE